MAEYDVLGYQAVDKGASVAFYDAEDCIFVVHASSAASHSQREDLVKTYAAGRNIGHISGQVSIQASIRSLLGLNE